MWLALFGGALIGLSASIYWSVNGRIAGISGILHGAVRGQGEERLIRALFLVGLLLAGVLFASLSSRIQSPDLPLGALAGAGLLVGLGTRLGGGCTSGHGVCGLSRFSGRSLVATLTFMASAALTVFLVRHVLKLWGAP